MTHAYSKETLYHYQCGDCRQWWTIGDAVPAWLMTCPYCARTAEAHRKPEVKFIDDGFDNWIVDECPKCKEPMEVVRPGKFQCAGGCE